MSQVKVIAAGMGRPWLALFGEVNQDQVAHYLSSFAEVLNPTNRVDELRGWIIKDVEIFKAGTYRGVTYTEDDVQAIVDNFAALKGRLDPVLKVDHSESARDQIGWILDARRSGELLLADLHVTEWEAYDKITSGTWKKVSAEIYLPELSETEFGIRSHVLRAVAVVSVPQVKDIKGIVLNSEAWGAGTDPGKTDPESRKGGNIRMDWEQFLAKLAELGITLSDEQKAAMQGLAAFTEGGAQTGAPIVINADQIVTLAERMNKLEGDKTELAGKVAELLKAGSKSDLERFADGLISEGKVLPAEKAGILALGEKLEGESLQAYKESLQARPKIVELGGGSGGQQQPGGGNPDDGDQEYSAFSEQFGQKTYN